MSFLTGIRKVCIPAPAKINLFLSIEGKRDDGFHELQTILAKVQLYDLVEIELTDNINGIEITCPGFLELENEGNLAIKMANNWLERTGLQKGIKISIDKNIPMEAGLGGGSSDAVATLIGLNALSEVKMTFEEMHSLCTKVGSDCPSFLISGICAASGRGEKIREVNPLIRNKVSGKRILLFKPPCGFSTADIYGMFQNEDILFNERAKIESRIKDWEAGKLSLSKFIHNDLSGPVYRKYLFIPVLFEEIIERFSLNPMVSGSGSCCFLFVPEEMDLEPVQVFIREAWGDDTFLKETRVI